MHFAADGVLRSFTARQFLLPGGGNGAEVKLFRGGTVVAPTPSADEDRAGDLADGIGQWMLSNLSADDGLPTDLRGRFYNPNRPEFGPPHASSTGVYLEGLADADALARAVGDHARAANYQRAIRRGLRSLRQLQFRDERDAFYVSRKKRVMGALRTEVYDNAVRVDSAAHALLTAIKILRPMEFGAGAASLA